MTFAVFAQADGALIAFAIYDFNAVFEEVCASSGARGDRKCGRHVEVVEREDDLKVVAVELEDGPKVGSQEKGAEKKRLEDTVYILGLDGRKR